MNRSHVLLATTLLTTLALNGVVAPSTNDELPATNQAKLTVVFDMDFTLAFVTTSFLETYNGKRTKEWLPVKMGWRKLYVWPRKDAVECLQAAAQLYNLVVVTHSEKDYADAVLSVLDPQGNIRFRFYDGDKDIVVHSHEGKERFVVKNIESILNRIIAGEEDDVHAQPQVNFKPIVDSTVASSTDQNDKGHLTQVDHQGSTTVTTTSVDSSGTDAKVTGNEKLEQKKVPEVNEKGTEGTEQAPEVPETGTEGTEEKSEDTEQVPVGIEPVSEEIRKTFLFKNSIFVEDSPCCTLKGPNNAFLTSEWHGETDEVDGYPMMGLLAVLAELQAWLNAGQNIKDFKPLRVHRKRIRAAVHEQLGAYYREVASTDHKTASDLQTLVDTAYPLPDKVILADKQLAPHPDEGSSTDTNQTPPTDPPPTTPATPQLANSSADRRGGPKKEIKRLRSSGVVTATMANNVVKQAVQGIPPTNVQ